MLGDVLPNAYSAPTGYHEMNQYALDDDANPAGDELDRAISEDGSSTRSLTPPPKAAPVGARPEHSPAARAAPAPSKSAPPGKSRPAAKNGALAASAQARREAIVAIAAEALDEALAADDLRRQPAQPLGSMSVTGNPPRGPVIPKQSVPPLDLLTADSWHPTAVRENALLNDQLRQLSANLSELRISHMQLQNSYDTLQLQNRFGVRPVPTAGNSTPPAQYLGDSTECTLCLESFVQGELTIRLRCGHAFHQSCWDRRRTADSGAARPCPNCRAPNASIQGLWNWVRTDVPTQLLPDGTLATNLLADADVDMITSVLDQDSQDSFESQVPPRPEPSSRSGPYSQEVSHQDTRPIVIGPPADVTGSSTDMPLDAAAPSASITGLTAGDFSDVYGLRSRTPDLGNISTTSEAEMLARVQAMQLMHQFQPSEGPSNDTVSPLEPSVPETSEGVNFGPWHELSVPEAGVLPAQLPLDSATGPAPEGFNVSPTTTPRVSFTDFGVPVIDLEAAEIPVVDLLGDADASLALPAFPATTDDSEILADDWIYGHNSFEVTSPVVRETNSPCVRTAREFMPVNPRQNLSEARQIRSVSEGTTNLARHAPGISTLEASDNATTASQDPQGLVIDTAAPFNFCGDQWARALDNNAFGHKKFSHWEARQTSRTPQFSGIGHGTQEAGYDVSLPMALMTTDGKPAVGTFEAPCIQNSNIPGVIGLKSLEENRVVLDTVRSKIYLLEEGEYDLTSCFPAGTKCFDLQRSATGHLVLPVGRFKDVEAAQRARESPTEDTGSGAASSQSSSSGLQLQGATDFQIRETENLMNELQAVGETDLASQVAACAQYLLDGDFGTPQQNGNEDISSHVPQVDDKTLAPIPEYPDPAYRAEERTQKKSHARSAKDAEARKREAYAAWGVPIPQPVQTGPAQSQENPNVPETCRYCHGPTTNDKGVQTIMWTTMLVPASEMKAIPCCSAECLIKQCGGKSAANKEAMRKKFARMYPRYRISSQSSSSSSNPSVAGGTEPYVAPSANSHVESPQNDRRPKRIAQKTKTVVPELPPSEEEHDSDEDHPMAFLSADGVHSMGTRKDYIDSIGRENVRWIFTDQGVRIPVDARLHPEDAETTNYSDLFPAEAGYYSE